VTRLPVDVLTGKRKKENPPVNVNSKTKRPLGGGARLVSQQKMGKTVGKSFLDSFCLGGGGGKREKEKPAKGKATEIFRGTRFKGQSDRVALGQWKERQKKAQRAPSRLKKRKRG